MVRLYEGCAHGMYNGENPKGLNTAQGYPCVHKYADMGARSDQKSLKFYTLDKVRKVGVTYALLDVPFGSSGLTCR
jgi:hypothetical protein